MGQLRIVGGSLDDRDVLYPIVLQALAKPLDGCIIDIHCKDATIGTHHSCQPGRKETIACPYVGDGYTRAHAQRRKDLRNSLPLFTLALLRSAALSTQRESEEQERNAD